MSGKTLSIRVITILVVVVVCFLAAKHGILKPPKAANLHYVKYVIDGDTVMLRNNEKIRYIGIDTPEVESPYTHEEPMGKEASAFNRKLVERKWVKLEFDVELRDKYGRLLAYVYVDDIFVNAELVKEGYARVFTFPPNVKHTDFFLKLQRKARENHKGLWGR
ncbi:MAG: thermonuclease family protein [Candidatus Omnitrophica bacterium]|nr:thermonuclease family protein [Candidatus Omnitrophota bacterium]